MSITPAAHPSSSLLLRRAPAFPLLGSLLEAETGAPLVLPLTEQPALLAFLLALKGSRPSLRQRLFTFQSEGGTTLFASPGDPAAAALGAAAGGAAGPAAGVATPDQQQEARVPLASSVFEEAPNPQLLSDGSATVAVLLPRELGLPTDAFAGLEALQVCVYLLGVALEMRSSACTGSRACLFAIECSRRGGIATCAWLLLLYMLLLMSKYHSSTLPGSGCRPGQPASLGAHRRRRRAACTARAILAAAASRAA